jgi:SAM-dependent methyltransferase
MNKKLVRSLLLGLGLTGSVMIAWRYVSRIKPLPCPAWMSGLMENPLTRGVMDAPLLVQRAGLKSGMHVLDAGCGAGRVTVEAAERVGETGEIVALDIQPAMLEKARARSKQAGVNNVRFMLSALGEGMLPENRFDRALLITVLGEIPDRRAGLNEIAASLKPGGILSITEMMPDPHYQTIHSIRLLADSAGLLESRVFGNKLVYTINFRKPVKH